MTRCWRCVCLGIKPPGIARWCCWNADRDNELRAEKGMKTCP